MIILIMIVQSQQNDYFNYDLFKVSKISILIMTCSKLAVLNKALHDAF